MIQYPKNFNVAKKEFEVAELKARREFEKCYHVGELIEFQKGNMLSPARAEVVYIHSRFFELTVENCSTGKQRRIGHYDLIGISQKHSW